MGRAKTVERKPAAPARIGAPHLAAALAVAVLAIYWQVGGFAFVNFDDDLYVTANQQVRRGLTPEGIAWAFSAWDYIYWHPLAFLSHMLDVSLFGLDAGFHHLTSALLHAASSALLLLALFRMTGALWRSGAVAALFALHPLRVESVAWVAERKDVLSGLFCILTLIAYERWARRSGPRWAWLLCGALGLMSKPMLVTLPFVLMLVDEWPLRRAEPLWRRTIEKAPLFAMAMGVSIVTYFGQVKFGAAREMAHVPIATRLANAAVSYIHYLAKTFWPNPLAVFYPYREDIPWVWALSSALALAVLSAGALWMRTRRPYLFTGWFWFVGMLVPTIGIVQVGAQSMADRCSYLASIGLFTALVWWAAELPWSPRAMGAVSGVVLTAFAAVSWIQIGYWRDGATLFAHAVEVTRDNALAQHNLGFALAERGDHQAAIPHLREAVRLKPEYFQGSYNLGRSLAALGRRDEALAAFDRAVEQKPDYAEAQYARATTLTQLGRAREAEAAWRTALAMPLDPAYAAEGHNSLGILLGQKGDYPSARAEFERALQLRPDLQPARQNLRMIQSMVK